MGISYNSWFCCQLDGTETIELCRIRKRTVSDSNIGYRNEWYVITYYDCKEVFSGSLFECRKWIENHWIERRYLDQYGED